MHELGYDVFSLPQVHLSEQRRLAEGRLVENQLRREHQTAAESDREPWQTRLKQASKERALENFKEGRGMN